MHESEEELSHPKRYALNLEYAFRKAESQHIKKDAIRIELSRRKGTKEVSNRSKKQEKKL